LKEIIRSLFGAIVTNYWGALFFFLFGVFFIWYSYKYPTKDANIRGWYAGIGGIILAILIITFKLTE